MAKDTQKQRAKPGEKGGGDFYRIEVRDKTEFTDFRNHDVGKKGGLQRLAGKRSSGSWSTVTWLVSKNFAHKSGDTLVPDHEDAKELFKKLGSTPTHQKGDVFTAT